MKQFGSVKFDFVKNKIQIGNVWLNSLSIQNKGRVKLKENATLQARSKQVVVLIKCKPNLALLTSDFERCKIKGLQGVYATRARVIPNVEGLFQITFLNVTEKDIEVNARKFVGFIYIQLEKL